MALLRLCCNPPTPATSTIIFYFQIRLSCDCERTELPGSVMAMRLPLVVLIWSGQAGSWSDVTVQHFHPPTFGVCPTTLCVAYARLAKKQDRRTGTFSYIRRHEESQETWVSVDEEPLRRDCAGITPRGTYCRHSRTTGYNAHETNKLNRLSIMHNGSGRSGLEHGPNQAQLIGDRRTVLVYGCGFQDHTQSYRS